MRHHAHVTYRIPLWVRMYLAADRFATRLENVRQDLRDELLLSWIPPKDRSALTAAVYARNSTYLPGGNRFESGLFGWERRMLDSPHFPRSGRVLLGASGGGRELVDLLERGFEVVAFDPCAPFVEGAERASSSRATVVLASYDDLIDAVAGREGPLAFLRESPPFDAVVLGWGSLSHVTSRERRRRLLEALHAIAPRAPVMTSFLSDGDRRKKGRGPVRETLKRLFATLDAPGASEAGDHFDPNAGFFTSLTTDEITASAREAGYEVAMLESSPYPHALLVPRATKSG